MTDEPDPRGVDPAADEVDLSPEADPERRRPAGYCRGPGHIVAYGNHAFGDVFGERSVGLPAREVMVGLPGEAFTLLDAVLREGRPLARWIRRGGEDWRMTCAPRIDAVTGEVYGVAFHLRARSDLLVEDVPRA